MKLKIFKATALLVIIFSVFIIFENSSAKEQLPPADHVCVYLNGVLVTGAKVNICNAGISDNTSNGCIGFTLDSGTYQIVANYGGYGGQTTGEFTSSPNSFDVHLVSGNVGCDNN